MRNIQNSPLTAGAALARCIKNRGIQTVFSLAGAGHTHFLLPLEDAGVKIIGTRHETGAVGAADGYARASGQIGVAAIIAEQGLPNAISPLSTAFHNGSPLVVLATRFPDSWVEAAGEYAVDHHALVSPICKWVRTVPSPEKLVEHFNVACKIALSGRPGPVVLVIPQDFLGKTISKTPAPKETPSLAIPASASPEAVAAAAALMATAERPAILIDTGLLDADKMGELAAQGLSSLNSDFGIPVFSYGSARGVIAENNTKVLPWPYAQAAMKDIDLLLIAGARLNMWFGFGRAPRFPDTLKTIQVDTDPAEIGRNAPVTLGCSGDPASTLIALSEALKALKVEFEPPQWLNESLAKRGGAVNTLIARQKGPLHALELLNAMESARPKTGFFIADGADILNWSFGLVRIKRNRGFMDHHPLGSMGVGLPLAIGAAAAERDIAKREGRKEVKCTLLTGDGALGFYIAELDTIAKENLPLTIIVGNDGQWGTEVHGQRLVTGRTVNTHIGVGNYGDIARGFKLNDYTVDDRSELRSTIAEAYSNEGPSLIDVRIDPDAGQALKINPDLSFLIFSDLAPPSI